MSIIDSLSVSLIVMSIVFSVLALLSLLLKVQSTVVTSLEKNKVHKTNSSEPTNYTSIEQNPAKEIASGELELINVDERTAAMAMAIVSDELKVPLNELKFKSIKGLD